MLFLKTFQKVESVQCATENAAPPSFSPSPKPCCFNTFQPLTAEQVLILIKRAPDKTSDLDPVPTWLVQEFAPIFAPFFLSQYCIPVASLPGRSHLRSAASGDLFVPATSTKTIGPRGFFHAGPAAWNCLPSSLKDPNINVRWVKERTFLTLYSDILYFQYFCDDDAV